MIATVGFDNLSDYPLANPLATCLPPCYTKWVTEPDGLV
jgi:hypothetical protein